MTHAQRRKFIIGMVAISVILSCLYFLWHEDFAQFWTAVLGAVYLYFDKIEEKKEEKEG
jgi:phosphatidylglycerophosphate synthase